MSDIKTKDERSHNMASIKSKNTKPEIYLRKKLFAEGFRFRLHSSTVPGHPDLFLRKYNTAVFVNGCFWHRHLNCKYAYTPKSRIDFWSNKFQNNIKRDKKVRGELMEKGIRCLIVWECTIKKAWKNEDLEAKLLNQIKEFLQGNDQYLEI